MTSIKARRREIINHLWSYTTTDAKRSPDFHKWLEELIKRDRAELKDEILSELEKVDSYYDAKEVVKNFKIK
jgi:hypothetical protein